MFVFDNHFSDSITTVRHFAPVAGVNEDPVTVIASDALGSYLFEFGKDNTLLSFQMVQEFNLSRNGIIHVEISKEDRL